MRTEFLAMTRGRAAAAKEPLERRLSLPRRLSLESQRLSRLSLRLSTGQVVPNAEVPRRFELPPGLAEIFPAGLPPRLVVLGAGGAGKTVLTKQLVVGTSLELLRGATVLLLHPCCFVCLVSCPVAGGM